MAQFGLSATKSYDGDDGLVCISGWKQYANGRTILLSVSDESSGKSWTRIVDCKPSTKSTIRIRVPKPSVDEELLVTAEPLLEKEGGVRQSGERQFSVESIVSCTAKDTNDTRQDALSHLLSRLSVKDVKVEPKLMSVDLDRASFDGASLIITSYTPLVRRWIVTVVQTDRPHPKFVFLVPAESSPMDFEVPVVFQAGSSYSVDVEGLDLTGGIIICHRRINFQATLTLEDIHSLHQTAISHAGTKHAFCRVFYRNKKPKYFKKILKSRGGIMEAYMKDYSGDPGSPINGRLNGLFFMASVKPGSKTGEPNPESAFGRRRILVPAEELLGKASRLYFADFYCMQGKTHYVTLVMTRPGSNADRFCSSHLLSLDVRNRADNPFLFYGEAGRLQVCSRKNFIVELYFTEDIDIRGYKMCTTPIFGKGHSTDGGVPKNPTCTKCNLRPQQNTVYASPETTQYSF